MYALLSILTYGSNLTLTEGFGVFLKQNCTFYDPFLALQWFLGLCLRAKEKMPLKI